jgi:hypothetical protein
MGDRSRGQCCQCNAFHAVTRDPQSVSRPDISGLLGEDILLIGVRQWIDKGGDDTVRPIGPAAESGMGVSPVFSVPPVPPVDGRDARPTLSPATGGARGMSFVSGSWDDQANRSGFGSTAGI